MPTTGARGVPLPVGGDPADVPHDLTSLGTWLNAASARVILVRDGSGPPSNANPPATPSDGFWYVDNSASLVYRSQQASDGTWTWVTVNPTPTVNSVTGLTAALTSLSQTDSSEAAARASADSQLQTALNGQGSAITTLQSKVASLAVPMGFSVPGPSAVGPSTAVFVAPRAYAISGFQAVLGSGNGGTVGLTVYGNAVGSASPALTTSSQATTFSRSVTGARGDSIGVQYLTAGSTASDLSVSLDLAFTA